tara:strand:+ start:1132 stop:1305 length:174 start_codon:yes stop_codon:yes gene_type:complete
MYEFYQEVKLAGEKGFIKTVRCNVAVVGQLIPGRIARCKAAGARYRLARSGIIVEAG